ncbi:uncharacterized [Tachysurus ichikawai]
MPRRTYRVPSECVSQHRATSLNPSLDKTPSPPAQPEICRSTQQVLTRDIRKDIRIADSIAHILIKCILVLYA